MSLGYRGGGQPLLHVVAAYGTLSDLREILKSKPNVNVQNENGQTALQRAIFRGRLDNIEALINAGARCDIYDYSGSSALIDATRLDFNDVLKLMLDSKPDLNAQNDSGKTALHIVGFLGKLESVDLILQSGARFDVVDFGGKTFMCYLVTALTKNEPLSTDLSLVERILDRTKEITIIDNKTGDTMMHYFLRCISALYFDIELVKLIILKQKDLNIKNRSGETPLNVFRGRYRFFNSIQCSVLTRLMVTNHAYMNKQDCKSILENELLCNELFKDVDFCAKAIINEFTCKTLLKFYSLLPTTAKIPSIDIMRATLLPRLSMVIIHDIRSQIDKNSYCDVSSLVTTSLSKRCVEVYALHHLQQISSENEHSCSEGQNSSVDKNEEKRQLTFYAPDFFK